MKIQHYSGSFIKYMDSNLRKATADNLEKYGLRSIDDEYKTSS